jgi:SAM-dependent methyltransferase
MNGLENCICSAPLKRKPFSEHFDSMYCSACGSSRFVAANRHGNAAPEFQYDGNNEKYADKGYLHGKQLRWAHLELLRLNWSGRKVLEIGCFNGFFLDELRQRGADVHGFDVNCAAITVGEELFGLSGRLVTSLDRLAAQGPFDDILCIDVLEHLDQPNAFLQELQDLLKTTGRVVVAGPTLERGFHDKSDFPPHHKWWFSRPGLRSLLQHSGFEVLETSIQRDGMLFVRNFIGKALTGISNREFYGQTAINAPNVESAAHRMLYASLNALGTVVFTLLRISYCSAIFIAQKARQP